MIFSTSTFTALATSFALVSSSLAEPAGTPTRFAKRACASPAPNALTVHTPKVMIVSMFSYERAVWIAPLQLTTLVSPQVIGLSPLYPDVACNHAGDVCIVTTVMALTLSRQFDFTKTYFLIAGIAGINPYHGTLATAAFARFAIQVALEYEIDARQMPANWTTGNSGIIVVADYNFTDAQMSLNPQDIGRLAQISQGRFPRYVWTGRQGKARLKLTRTSTTKTSDLYGTEIFELNTNLLAKVMTLTKNVKLNDSVSAIAYRAKFDYAPANLAPVVTSCDVATSDVYYAGTLLSESFGNYSSYMTGGKAIYCMTAQEDNASLEALVRGRLCMAHIEDPEHLLICRLVFFTAHKGGLVDYSRIVVLRTGSDFDRAPPGAVSAYAAFEANQGGFSPALQNLVIAGTPVITDSKKFPHPIVSTWRSDKSFFFSPVLANWNSLYNKGLPTQATGDGSFYGDDLGTIRAGVAQARLRERSMEAEIRAARA
ncbi:hypothetical protein P7C70_g1579, partial [Phenoliferia sp. Uapishka_3]